MESRSTKLRIKPVGNNKAGYESDAFAGQDAEQIRMASIGILQVAERLFVRNNESYGLIMVKLAWRLMQGPPDDPEARQLCLLYRWIGDRLVVVGRRRTAMDFHCLYEKFHRQDVSQWPWFETSPSS